MGLVVLFDTCVSAICSMRQILGRVAFLLCLAVGSKDVFGVSPYCTSRCRFVHGRSTTGRSTEVRRKNRDRDPVVGIAVNCVNWDFKDPVRGISRIPLEPEMIQSLYSWTPPTTFQPWIWWKRHWTSTGT